MKRTERILFACLIAAAAGSIVLAVFLRPSDKWVSTASVLLGLAGVVQLEISGLFEAIMTQYTDENQYPFGPPSNITRQIIDDPDRPIRTWLRNTAFFNRRTGFQLIVLGGVLQLISIWL